jgi:hypothetical protein
MLSRVPDHPALVLLSQNPQGSPAAEEDSTRATRSTADINETFNGGGCASTAATSSSNDTGRTLQSSKPPAKPRDAPALKNPRSIHSQSDSGAETRAKAEKRKTRSDESADDPDSYEVEEILDHHQDAQARIYFLC